MPYCQTNFRAVPPERVEEVLSSLTKESFVGGQSAYQLEDGSYSIDAGENDIRAIYDEEEVVFRILCHFVKLSKKEMTYDQKQFRHGCRFKAVA